MLALIGLLTILSVVVLLLLGRASPLLALSLVPLAGALLAGFGLGEISGFFGDGLRRVMQVATMFIFAITFFGVLQDAGLFRPLIRGLVALTRGNVVAVTMGTAVIGMLAHLDGAGATTFLLTVPALLPLYRRLGMNPYLMLMMLATGAGIFNMMPWAGPLGRAAAVTGIEVTELWRPLIPVQAAGVVLLLALAALLGLREQRRIAAAGAGAGAAPGAAEDAAAEAGAPSAAEAALERPHLLWANAALFLAVLATLVAGLLPAGYVFMLGLAVALLLNYRDPTLQMQRVAAHAPSALTMGIIILAAGSFLGIMDGTGMLKAMAEGLVQALPSGMVPVLHLLFGVVGLPMELVLSTDAYYFGLLPIVLEIVTPHGVAPAEVVHALTIGNIIGTFISPFSPALWLALGLAGAQIGPHIRYSVLWMWGFSLLLMGAAALLGLF
ncbi:CitMHS family transporter [Pseudoroseomonas cervicalis]|nr:citrate:proton symporter [Pseudoroseomonas cervicalis]WBV43081.1 citrate:proton symporter [Pseudoroseomonas cervicalis]